MSIKIISLIIALSLVFITCKSKEQTADNKPKEVIKKDNSLKYCVGKGGGFTGAYEEFMLYENGKVYKRDFVYERDVFKKQLSEVELNYFLEKINEIGLEGMDINQPGNMSYYFKVKQGEQTINTIIWGSNSYYPDKKLEAFHKEFFEKLASLE
ncbi:MAG: hypothetical protein CVT95_02210 [Bacteroidetes bacterium HGW-Bacteroidetes-12]|nr:MAG: hypothetical protein CVT95_02210 [Bacteroidetes bacterium HGW-Bacteroidetes-12]